MTIYHNQSFSSNCRNTACIGRNRNHCNILFCQCNAVKICLTVC